MEWRDKTMKETKLLIVVDMQNDFIDGSLGTPEAQAIISNVVKKIENWNGLYAVTLDTHDDTYLNTLEGQKLPIKHCINYTWGHKIHPQIEQAMSGKGAIDGKIYKDTFGSLFLMQLLKEPALTSLPIGYPDFIRINKDQITEIQLIGLCTDICVVSNALIAKAFFPEVPITVDASCCAGTTPENHKAALQVLKCCQIDVINEEETEK